MHSYPKKAMSAYQASAKPSQMSVDSFVDDAPSTPDFPSDHDASLFLGAGELSPRIVGLRDRGNEQRVKWIASWIRWAEFDIYNSDDTRLFSQVDGCFDSVILHGDDARRLSRIAREFRSIFRSKILIVVLSASRPADRAALFRAGADLVFDIATPTVVAIACLRSIIRRVDIYRSKANRRDEAPASVVIGLPGAGSFTPYELIVLLELERNIGRTTHHSRLLHRLRKPVSDDSMRALYIIVCKIREKLPDMISVKTVRGLGYILKVGA